MKHDLCVRNAKIVTADALFDGELYVKEGKVAAVTICPLRDACILTDRMPDEIYLSQTIIKEVD